MHNYAFIDSQNLNLGIQKLGWRLNYRKFRVYLKEKYDVAQAFMFIGFVATNQRLYDDLTAAGFILKFKPTIPDSEGKLEVVLSTHPDMCSSLLKSAGKEKVEFMYKLKDRLEYK